MRNHPPLPLPLPQPRQSMKRTPRLKRPHLLKVLAFEKQIDLRRSGLLARVFRECEC